MEISLTERSRIKCSKEE